MVICPVQGADLHMAQLMPLPLTVSCFSKIQIGFAFLVLARPLNVCVCVCVRACVRACVCVIDYSICTGNSYVNLIAWNIQYLMH